MPRPTRLLLTPLALALAGTVLVSPASAHTPPEPPAPPADDYVVDEEGLPFEPLPGAIASWGVLDDAGYRIEVPAQWNGDLLVWAHGYRGTGPELTVDNPPAGLREQLIAEGYAWTASSYDANGYDVVSGVRSTQELVDFFDETVGVPERRYLAGASMGGHVTGVSIEQFPDTWDGALPVCGVMGDRRLFDTFLDYNLAAQALTGVEPVYPAPRDYLDTTALTVEAALGTPYPGQLTPVGEQLAALTELRTGGERPLFEAGFDEFAEFLFTVFPADPGQGEEAGTVGGNADTVYQLDADPAVSPAEQQLNADVLRVEATPAPEGLAGVPTIDGTFEIPVLTMHDLGDLFVPFSMEQDYARDAVLHGTRDLLVQRAVRGVAHCDFSAEEYQQAFGDLVTWVEQGVRPEGDDVLDPAAVADPRFGCRFTVPQRAFDTQDCTPV
ncbi:phthalyl amidase [Modestobacter sp. I12A-02628]|uniref:Phthalyl amidase n=1 Tax=Goekera deserti TaxID=2497753 RepID=A0A7K3WG64_9ACTN|nr:phthalyl amidase [Goekera deserti]MPQ98065.1 phthalyl amidase [Goekera deserti]NDI48712.1 phthalyl amidase [Goekera deserti]NEL54909.1 phthalyl amidase [Goekera deserti]